MHEHHPMMAPKIRVFLLSVLFLVSHINCAPDGLVSESTTKENSTFSIEADDKALNNATEKQATPSLPVPTSTPTVLTDTPNYEEADDMEFHGTFENRTVFDDRTPIELPQFVEPPPNNLKSETEWLEENDPEAVDVDMPRSHAVVQLANERSWPWIIAMTALLMAIVFIIFIGLLSYKFLTLKYRNRQVLINEEDMVDPNDMKYFTL